MHIHAHIHGAGMEGRSLLEVDAKARMEYLRQKLNLTGGDGRAGAPVSLSSHAPVSLYQHPHAQVPSYAPSYAPSHAHAPRRQASHTQVPMPVEAHSDPRTHNMMHVKHRSQHILTAAEVLQSMDKQHSAAHSAGVDRHLKVHEDIPTSPPSTFPADEIISLLKQQNEQYQQILRSREALEQQQQPQPPPASFSFMTPPSPSQREASYSPSAADPRAVRRGKTQAPPVSQLSSLSLLQTSPPPENVHRISLHNLEALEDDEQRDAPASARSIARQRPAQQRQHDRNGDDSWYEKSPDAEAAAKGAPLRRFGGAAHAIRAANALRGRQRSRSRSMEPTEGSVDVSEGTGDEARVVESHRAPRDGSRSSTGGRSTHKSRQAKEPPTRTWKDFPARLRLRHVGLASWFCAILRRQTVVGKSQRGRQALGLSRLLERAAAELSSAYLLPPPGNSSSSSSPLSAPITPLVAALKEVKTTLHDFHMSSSLATMLSGKARKHAALFDDLVAVLDAIIQTIIKLQPGDRALQGAVIPALLAITSKRVTFPSDYLWNVEKSIGKVDLLNRLVNTPATARLLFLDFVIVRVFVKKILLTPVAIPGEPSPLASSNLKVLASIFTRIVREACGAPHKPLPLTSELEGVVFDDDSMQYIYKRLSTVMSANASLLQDWATIFITNMIKIKNIVVSQQQEQDHGQEEQ